MGGAKSAAGKEVVLLEVQSNGEGLLCFGSSGDSLIGAARGAVPSGVGSKGGYGWLQGRERPLSTGLHEGPGAACGEGADWGASPAKISGLAGYWNPGHVHVIDAPQGSLKMAWFWSCCIFSRLATA